MKLFIELFVIGLTLSSTTNAAHWSYPKSRSNGVIEDAENWGGECDTGDKQSPVDLAFEASVRGHFPAFMFENYDEPIDKATVTNNGHSIQINVGRHILFGGGLPGTFLLDQMHFHWGSEHTINGRRYGLELHLVHHDNRYPSLKEAAGAKRGLAVLGVLFHVAPEPNLVLAEILHASEKVKDNVGKTAFIEDDISPAMLLPHNRSTYFRYDGSLTTPGCGEAVIWTIYSHSLPISIDQIEQFKAIKTNEGHHLTHNFRSVQPLNHRPLVYVTTMDPQHHFSGASSTTASILVFTLVSIKLFLV